jgi:hypothetical protein
LNLFRNRTNYFRRGDDPEEELPRDRDDPEPELPLDEEEPPLRRTDLPDEPDDLLEPDEPDFRFTLVEELPDVDVLRFRVDVELFGTYVLWLDDPRVDLRYVLEDFVDPRVVFFMARVLVVDRELFVRVYVDFEYGVVRVFDVARNPLCVVEWSDIDRLTRASETEARYDFLYPTLEECVRLR